MDITWQSLRRGKLTILLRGPSNSGVLLLIAFVDATPMGGSDSSIDSCGNVIPE